jgi:hypothetical protein
MKEEKKTMSVDNISIKNQCPKKKVEVVTFSRFTSAPLSNNIWTVFS